LDQFEPALLDTILCIVGIIGLAQRHKVGNYSDNILRSSRNLHEVSDLVDFGGYWGNVVKLTSPATALLPPYGNHIRIPHATVFKTAIFNYTRATRCHIKFDVGVDTNQVLPAAHSLELHRRLAATGLPQDPNPLADVQSSVDINVNTDLCVNRLGAGRLPQDFQRGDSRGESSQRGRSSVARGTAAGLFPCCSGRRWERRKPFTTRVIFSRFSTATVLPATLA
jgi:hypothetical protein